MITVLCPKGGAGKTTVARTCRRSCAERTGGGGDRRPRPAVRRRGERAAAHSRHTVADAVRSPEARRHHAEGVPRRPTAVDLFALSAPLSPVDADEHRGGRTSSSVLRFLLSASFDYVVLDTGIRPRRADPGRTRGVDRPRPALGPRRPVRARDAQGDRGPAADAATDQRWHFVLNRSDARTGLSISDIESTVGLPVDVAVPELAHGAARPSTRGHDHRIRTRSAPARRCVAMTELIAPGRARGRRSPGTQRRQAAERRLREGQGTMKLSERLKQTAVRHAEGDGAGDRPAWPRLLPEAREGTSQPVDPWRS